MKQPTTAGDALSPLVISLMKGVMWREDNERHWQQLLSLQARVRDHVAVLGLRLELDEAEGYALLRQRPLEEGDELPRLIPRRPLSYPVSLLLVLLRKKLAEADGGGADRRVVLRREDLVEMLRHFLPDTTNEARLVDQVGSHINKVKDLGFLRPLGGREDEYEVVRLLNTFVDAQKLEELLASYRAHAETLGKEVPE
ncbi:DUF4194 domain-containing protein [Archangium violaceum]|uniref:DUF4194 domain-containing protein n=1 Tax=Archangium violaceum TaxID=83451 RepID=UPI001EEFFB1F|nr:DUF4194 domain-containing protein [Archangium violaceum]